MLLEHRDQTITECVLLLEFSFVYDNKFLFLSFMVQMSFLLPAI